MKKNKGFTLIELLAVIVILGVLVLVVFPPILKQINKSKKGIGEATKTLIIDASKDYYENNRQQFKKIDGVSYCIDVNTLAQDNYLNKELKDENLNNINLNQKVKMTYHNGNFEYEVVDACNYYTVTLDPDGGDVSEYEIQVLENSLYGDLPTPTKTGYTFMGWNGKNLFNKSLAVNNGIKNETGTQMWAIDILDRDWAENNLKNETSYAISYDIECIDIPSYDVVFNKQLGFLLFKDYDNPGINLNVQNKDFIKGKKDHITIIFNTPSNLTGYRFLGYTQRFLLNDETPVYTTIKFSNIQLEEGTEATEYEPYYITSDVKVTQNKAHTLKAIWKAND